MQTIAVILKGYPRLSETFVAQEIRSLERAGLPLTLVSLRHPTDKDTHPVHGEIRATVNYLPEYLHRQPGRVLRAWWRVRRMPGYRHALMRWIGDLARNPSRNRVRRFGQALVLVAELPPTVRHLHAHFIHTPASVTGYASRISGLPWSCSAHAKDIWTSAETELTEKLKAAEWVVTCSRAGHGILARLAPDRARVHLIYHGLDFGRFPPYQGSRLPRDGSDADAPVRLLTVGRAVAKKGLDVLLESLSRLPRGLHWRLTHIGDGDLVRNLQSGAARLGLAGQIEWAGARPQAEVLAAYREADVFVLPCRITADGDRDGLPNVLLEAASQRLACVSTVVSGVPELIESGRHGMLVPADDPRALAAVLADLIRDPALRERLGCSAQQRVLAEFDHDVTIGQLLGLLRSTSLPCRRSRPVGAVGVQSGAG